MEVDSPTLMDSNSVPARLSVCFLTMHTTTICFVRKHLNNRYEQKLALKGKAEKKNTRDCSRQMASESFPPTIYITKMASQWVWGVSSSCFIALLAL